MRPYRLPEVQVEIERGTVLLDTNVLVAYHYPRDENHKATRSYLDTTPAFAVTDAVVAEAWGLLIQDQDDGYSGAQRRYFCQRMLDWVTDPTSGVVVVPDVPEPLAPIARICRERSVDVVDVLVADLAHRLSTANIDFPPFPVASLDEDFYRLLEFYHYEVVDPRSP